MANYVTKHNSFPQHPSCTASYELNRDGVTYFYARNNKAVFIGSESLCDIRTERQLDNLLRSTGLFAEPKLVGRKHDTIIIDDLYDGHTHNAGIDALFRQVYSAPILSAFDERTPFKPTKGEKMRRTKKATVRSLTKELNELKDYLGDIRNQHDTRTYELRNRLYDATKVTEIQNLRTLTLSETATATIQAAKALGYTVEAGVNLNTNQVVFTAVKRVKA